MTNDASFFLDIQLISAQKGISDIHRPPAVQIRKGESYSAVFFKKLRDHCTAICACFSCIFYPIYNYEQKNRQICAKMRRRLAKFIFCRLTLFPIRSIIIGTIKWQSVCICRKGSVERGTHHRFCKSKGRRRKNDECRQYCGLRRYFG